MSVERLTHLDWAREQRNEPECAAAIRYLQLEQPSVLPVGFFADVPSARRTLFSEQRELAHKGRLYVDDNGLPVRKPTHRRPLNGRAAMLRVFSMTNRFAPTFRVDVPMEHATLPRQRLVPLCCRSHA